MFKRFLILILLFFPINIYASIVSGVRVGNLYFDTLEDAIEAAHTGDTIKLFSDMSLDDTLIIDKDITIDLNGNDIVSESTLFVVDGGKLKIVGNGSLKELNPYYGVIKVMGSSNYSDDEYSVVDISKDVFLKGWTGINISHNNFKSYGVVVNFNGKIDAINDTYGDSGIGIYVNGNIQDKINHPIINILDDAVIDSSGTGLYIAGYSTFNIGKAYISGIESGVGMKSGILNIDGTSVVCTGADKTPTVGNSNGIKASGTTFQLESNNDYVGDMEINIKDGNFTSKNSNVFYEYLGKGNNSLVKSVDISGGIFLSEKKDIFTVSNEFESMHSEFISGGNFSSNPDKYLKSGYSASYVDGMYKVVSSVLKEVGLFNNDFNDNGNLFEFMGIILSIIMILLVLYFNRKKILNLF